MGSSLVLWAQISMSLSTQSNLWLCNWWPSLACFEVTLLWKLKILTKQVNAPWHEGERLQSGQLASWRQPSQTVLRIETVCFKKFAQGIAFYWILERRGWQFDCNIVMSCPSLKEFPRVQLSPWAGKGVSGQQGTWVLLKIIKWYRKGVVSKTAPRDSMHCHIVTPSAQNWFMLGH